MYLPTPQILACNQRDCRLGVWAVFLALTQHSLSPLGSEAPSCPAAAPTWCSDLTGCSCPPHSAKRPHDHSLCPHLVPGGQVLASFDGALYRQGVAWRPGCSVRCASRSCDCPLGSLTASRALPSYRGPEGSSQLQAAGARVPAAPGAVRGPAAARLRAAAACPAGVEAAPRPVPAQVWGRREGVGP